MRPFLFKHRPPLISGLVLTGLAVIMAVYARAPFTKLDWQPVQAYFSRLPSGTSPEYHQGTRRVNTFVNYTHLGTDFGFHGPAAYEVQWNRDQIDVNLSQQPDHWAGMWHSLRGLASESHRTLNFTAPYPDWISPKFQPRIEAVEVVAAGSGIIKIEIKSATQAVLWSECITVADPKPTAYRLALPTDQVRDAKFLNWTAEPRSDWSLHSLSLGFAMPLCSAEIDVFLRSYAKASLNYQDGSGLSRDRAHIEGGAFDSITSTGLFALATAAAATPELGIVPQDAARQIVTAIAAKVATLPKASGLLPHFARHSKESGFAIHPGTEFSTVDTAIYLHSMLLAAEMLDCPTLTQSLLKAIQAIDYAALSMPDGTLSHGIKDDGMTLLASKWGDWGGETALVRLLREMAHPTGIRLPMERPGQPWLGTGFICELQSLFYPDFDSDSPDAINQLSWREARTNHLREQRRYIATEWADSRSTHRGYYGLSAGENEFGNGYHVGGTTLPKQRLIHPHYMLMASGLRKDLPTLMRTLGRLKSDGLLPPFGLVENFTVDGNSYLPMNGSLNAGFEAVAAYHLACRVQPRENRIYEAAMSSPLFRQAIQLFYPAPAKTKPEGRTAMR